MVRSMTAYSRKVEKQAWGTLIIEVRSVNHRFLDVHCRLPDELKVLEPAVREKLKNRLSRGKVDVNLHLDIVNNTTQNFEFNQGMAHSLATTLHEIDKLLYNAAPTSAIDVLQWPGILKVSSVDDDLLKQGCLDIVDHVLEDLLLAREREGKALKTCILQRCEQLAKEIQDVQLAMPEILQEQREKVQKHLSDLQLDVDSNRLEQEIALLVYKMDVAEELDRLTVHIQEVQHLLELSVACGRKLDFIMQEMNREANTLGSKSAHKSTTRGAVNMKVLIEQMREQIQNIE